MNISDEQMEKSIKKFMDEHDYVEVVRCKDCKHHDDEEIGMVYCPNIVGGWVDNDWFCADGEMKEGVHNGII